LGDVLLPKILPTPPEDTKIMFLENIRVRSTLEILKKNKAI